MTENEVEEVIEEIVTTIEAITAQYLELVLKVNVLMARDASKCDCSCRNVIGSAQWGDRIGDTG